MSEHIEINADWLRQHCCGPVMLRDGSRAWLVGQDSDDTWFLRRQQSTTHVHDHGRLFPEKREHEHDIIGPWVEQIVPECPGWTPPAGMWLRLRADRTTYLHSHKPMTGGLDYRGSWSALDTRVLPVIWPEGTDWKDCCCSTDLVRKAQGVGE